MKPPTPSDLAKLTGELETMRAVAQGNKRNVAILAKAYEELEAERDKARAKVAEYENAINWNSSCLRCAVVLDSMLRETERAERAEAALDRVRALHVPGKFVDQDFCRACSPLGMWVDWPCPTLAALDAREVA